MESGEDWIGFEVDGADEGGREEGVGTRQGKNKSETEEQEAALSKKGTAAPGRPDEARQFAGVTYD